MVAESELIGDIDELKALLKQAVRQNVKNFLSSQIRRLENELEAARKTDLANSQPKPTQSSTATAVNVPLPLLKISTYAWEESDAFLKLYVTVPDVHTVPESSVAVKYGPKNVSMTCNNVCGNNYEMSITGLFKPIDPENSKHKIKTGQVLIMMRKLKTGETWGCVTEQEHKQQEKRKPKFDKDDDPSASMMNMMKNMYDEGDDEMKRTIKKAWFESQQKKATGADSMGPDMGFSM